MHLGGEGIVEIFYGELPKEGDLLGSLIIILDE